MSFDGFLDALEAPAPSPCGGTGGSGRRSHGSRARHDGRARLEHVGRRRRHRRPGKGSASPADGARRGRCRGVRECACDDARSHRHSRAARLRARCRHSSVPPRFRSRSARRRRMSRSSPRSRRAEGAPHLRPDAAAAAVLTEAAVRAATHLVEINLAVVPGDQHSESARATLGRGGRRSRASAQVSDATHSCLEPECGSRGHHCDTRRVAGSHHAGLGDRRRQGRGCRRLHPRQRRRRRTSSRRRSRKRRSRPHRW